MIKALAIWRNRQAAKKSQDLKNRILKNRGGVLDAMAENIKGARQCEGLLGNKCIGILCEKFQEYKTINSDTKKEFKYYRCVHVQVPHLLMELIRDINLLRKELRDGKAT